MNRNLEKEIEIFRNLNLKDYELIISDEINFQDYERLSFILQRLKLISLDIYLYEKHHHKFKKQYKMLDKLNDEYGTYIDTEMLDNWLESFVNGIVDSSKRDYVKELFKI